MKRKSKGFTLIELMVALVISALMVGATYSVFIGQQRTYATQTGVMDMQQNARAAMTMMLRELRMAGFGVGNSGFNVEGFTQAITVVNNTGQPDQITVVYAAEQVSTVQSVSGTQVTLADGGDSFDTDKKKYIAFETLRTVYTITTVTGNNLTLNGSPPSYLADFGAGAFLVKTITYQVDSSRHTLERVQSTQTPPGSDPEDLWDDAANYIEDLQVDYPYNGDNELLKVTLTSSFQDCEGSTKRRGYEAIINIRNIGI
ncbi:MAG: prepilin-type N-terminal cleavage/methylation domain-containing protein [Deltaproteobacteria bacterium]|nr:prepilin-type N-terminal cleavage/methylation domain-containing protein [Deltaproteobacteria bacterium]